MASNEYDNHNPATVASEPAVAYRTGSSVRTLVERNRSMTVDEYFDKVKKALDKRYENISNITAAIDARRRTGPRRHDMAAGSCRCSHRCPPSHRPTLA